MHHKFSVGQVANLIPNPRQSNRPSGNCRIIACLPYERGAVQYRVQADRETVERVVDQDDLRPTDTRDRIEADAREAVFAGVRVVRR